MDVHFSHIDFSEKISIYESLYKLLPKQGCVEFQRDEANKEHTWHRHKNDETLLIVEGGLNFFYEDKIQRCGPGDIIYLPSMVEHQSIASDQGCIYAIAAQLIKLS